MFLIISLFVPKTIRARSANGELLVISGHVEACVFEIGGLKVARCCIVLAEQLGLQMSRVL